MDLPINQIICGDCLEVMKTFPDKSIDLVLTDPPYGIAYDNDKLRRHSSEHFGKIENDNGELDYKELIIELMRIGKRVIIFGAINFLRDLPYKGIWICWDKRTKIEADGVFGSPFELAWCDKIGGYDKIYRVMHGGVINNDGKNSPRFHPTQKPIQLMGLIMKDFSNENDLILDPFLGSGTTAVAAKQLHRRYIGLEISQKYCDIAKSRLGQEVLF
jgi:site-specific DNA-methyltransferase (adenine-specific)